MKKIILKPLSIFAIFAFSLSLMSMATSDDANRKFWGSQESNCVTEYVGGGCSQRFCDYDYYVLWINIEHLEHIPSGQMICH